MENAFSECRPGVSFCKWFRVAENLVFKIAFHFWTKALNISFPLGDLGSIGDHLEILQPDMISLNDPNSEKQFFNICCNVGKVSQITN